MNDRPGRNDPCWCGSGKKYKKCHAGADGKKTQLKPKKKLFRNPLLLDEAERECMRRACKVNASLLDHLRPHVVAGVTTNELDRIAAEYTREHGHTGACLGYRGYPKTICTSINEVICHGIPEDRALVDGDIVNVDCTTIVDGWHGDQSETFLIGDVSDEARQLVQVTFDSLYLAIDALTPGCSINDIGRTITRYAEDRGYSVVRDYQGHGIGRKFHQKPDVLHYPERSQESVALPPGICFTVEPMLNVGTYKTELDSKDGWTVRTLDRSLSAQFEHTVLMTETGPEIMTWTENGPRPGHTF
ncbi:MAG: methionyl aminopeptidase [Planctomycetota bacterium]